MDKYIYVVGRPYPEIEIVAKIHALGFKAGLFLDETITRNPKAAYDRIIRLDFSHYQNLQTQLDSYDVASVSGLICIYENYLLAKAELGKIFHVPTTSLEAAAKCTDKHLMRQAFMAANPSITPDYALVHNQAELLAFAGQHTYPLIIKPANLVKSLLVMRCNNEAELTQNYQYATETISDLYAKYNVYDRTPQIIVEEYIIGKSCSIAAMVDQHGEAHFCAGIVGLTTAHDIGIDDSYIYERALPAISDDQNLRHKLFSVAKQGVKALGLTSSAAHIELIYNDHEVKIVEIGARIGGYRARMYEYCYSIDLLAQELQLAIGRMPKLTGTLQAYCGVYELFPKTKGAFVSVPSMNEHVYLYYRLKATLGQPIGPAEQGYKATAIIMLGAPDSSSFSKLHERVADLKVEVN